MTPRSRLGLASLLAGCLAIAFGTWYVGTRHGAAQEPKPDRPGKVEPHPLDPLSEAELKAVPGILAADRKLPEGSVFALIALNEPDKAVVLAHKPGMLAPRAALAVVLDVRGNKTYEAVVDLVGRKTISWKHVPGVQPALLPREFTSGAEVVRADARWQEAMKKRGITDFASVQIDTWAPGRVAGNTRLVRAVSYLRDGITNAYGRPIEGVVAIVDMNQGKVLDVIDRGPAPMPSKESDFFDPKNRGTPRTGLKPLETTQPNGPSFTVAGHEIRWQNWRFRFALHPREGLVLYTVAYQDGEALRPILYRASLAEMVVPYADPTPDTWAWRNAFDEGEYGIGQLTSPQRAGQEAPGQAVVFDAWVADETGLPTRRPGAVALWEQDGGLLWTHTNYLANKTITRRARQLVLQSLFTVGNYDYLLKWVFHQDGSLELQAELTGILQARAVADEKCPVCKQQPDAEGRLVATGADRHGKFVAPHVLAPLHQHFFSFRLDLDVDGPINRVQEMNVRRDAPTTDNRELNAFLVEQHLLRSEREAVRDLDMAAHRTWKVVAAGRPTALGHTPGYKLEPGANAVPLAHPAASVRQRAGFMNHHFWATPLRPGELYAAGTYPNQSRGGDGLPRWVRANESLVDRDVVVWYTLGVTHAPRPEEWPVMPVARTGFRLVPDGFFTRNPALDVPAAR